VAPKINHERNCKLSKNLLTAGFATLVFVGLIVAMFAFANAIQQDARYHSAGMNPIGYSIIVPGHH
jgi:hypothetical protein